MVKKIRVFFALMAPLRLNLLLTQNMKNLTKKPNHFLLSLIMLLMVMLVSPAAGASPASLTGRILYCKPATSADCSSWSSACELNQALSLALPGDEIWAAAGTYYPGPPGSPLSTFQLKDGVGIYGGFSGDESSRLSRDWNLNLTILSGDIDRNGLLDAGNAYHVVTASGTGATANLDGFTITGGNASGDLHNNGGGLYSSSGSPNLSNLTFTANRAKSYGGAIYLYLSNPKLSGVTFTQNTALRGGGMYNYLSTPSLARASFTANTAEQGGGMYNYVARDMPLSELSFSANTADDGAGMFNAYSPYSLDSATFHANTASRGGGTYNYYSSFTLTNVTFHANSASTGGGIYSYTSQAELVNVTIYTNLGSAGGGIYNQVSSLSLRNAIVWGNTPLVSQLAGDVETYLYDYSDIQVGTGYEGLGNISLNPLLGELADNGGSTRTHALLKGSPAIDAGDPLNCPAQDQRGVPRPQDGTGDGVEVCDMGAFEVQLPPGAVFLPAVLKR